MIVLASSILLSFNNESIVAYQRVKNRVELNTPKSVEIKKETFTIQQATINSVKSIV